MNPNAAVFQFNPTAPSFVPKASQPPAQPPATQEKPKEEKPKVVSPPQEKKVSAPKPESDESWEEVEDKKKEKTNTTSNDSDSNFEVSNEELKKELQKIAAEEGITEEELLKGDKEGELAIVEEKEDDREHVNIVFIGHVDAGKSTISGSLLFITGMVDKRTIEKYEREAKENHRESWFYAYVMDTNEEERAKGKTVEVGRADFETKVKRYTILDAPGHKAYVPNMIGGASQADVGVLVISAKKGEFESGFSKGGQTKEHTMLAKTLGIKVIVVVVNKMDDSTVNWSKERYDQIVNDITGFAKTCGYNAKSDVHFLPVSGLKGHNLQERVPSSVAPWYEGGTLLELLDGLKPVERLNDFPLRIPLTDRFKDRGLVTAMGKVESGELVKGASLNVIPNNSPCEVVAIYINDTTRVRVAKAGENIRVVLKGIDEDRLQKGYILCDKLKPIPCQTKFEAQLLILELLPHKSIFTAGYASIIHIHTAVEECTVNVLISQLDKKTMKVTKAKPQFVKSGAAVNVIIECAQPIPLELYSDNAQLGRFTLRDEGKTIAIGKVIALGPKKKPVANA